MKFTFGTDPELMIIQDGEFKSAIGILPKKEESIIKNGNEYYFDNVLAEIAVKPATNKDLALSNIKQSLRDLASIINPGKFIIEASATYPKSELTCFDAKVAGCNPEWNVYNFQQILPSDKYVDLMEGYYQFTTQFRCAGGHIHVGSNVLQDPYDVFNMIRMMDLFLAIPALFLDTNLTSKNRRKVYGLAGSHRITDYGLEYRALSNFWLSSPEHAALIYDLTEFTLEFVNTKKHEKFWSVNEDLLDEEDSSVAYTCSGYDSDLLQIAINKSDLELAKKFMIFASNYLPTRILYQIDKLADQPLPDPYATWKINV